MNLADSVRALEQKRTDLEGQIADIDRKLQAVRGALGDGLKAVAVPVKAKPAQQDRVGWFERGEAPKLIAEIAKKPMRQAEVVRALVARKTRPGMGAADQKRLAWAAQSAVTSAMTQKVLKRRDGGKVSS